MMNQVNMKSMIQFSLNKGKYILYSDLKNFSQKGGALKKMNVAAQNQLTQASRSAGELKTELFTRLTFHLKTSVNAFRFYPCYLELAKIVQLQYSLSSFGFASTVVLPAKIVQGYLKFQCLK